MAKLDVYPVRKWLAILILMSISASDFAQYRMQVEMAEGDSMALQKAGIQTDFRNQGLCRTYVNRLPGLLQMKGYPAASVDSARFDSTQANIWLYLGDWYAWAGINTDSVDQAVLDAAGWNPKDFNDKPVNLEKLEALQRKMLDYLENNGYPFANIRLDSIAMVNGKMTGNMKLEKGPQYKIDSIRNFGEAQISNKYLQRYLNIINGSIYRKEKLLGISKKLADLPFLVEQQRWDITYLGTGSVLNLYLKPKRSSQVNVLIGLLPATQASNNIYEAVRTKLQFTGEATINLRNALGNGETIALNWQQIQVKSPRLNMAFQQPYLFGSPFGINAAFDLFKKDSSFQNINMMLGMQYAQSSDKTGTVFLQSTKSYLLTVDTFAVKNSRQLPPAADLNSINLGISYELYATNYRFNPRRGNEFLLLATAGTKKIKKNNVIVQLKDPNDPGFDFNQLYDTVKLKAYQFRLKLAGAHYFPLTKVSTFKTALNAGWYQSPSIYRNELFQIGGYRLLRGFDEESIYASFYTVATAEYRYLIGVNSYFFGFMDLGWIRNRANGGNFGNSFLGTGLGLAFETKAGIFNISYAAGKRNDQSFNLRQSKIHLGFVSYF